MAGAGGGGGGGREERPAGPGVSEARPDEGDAQSGVAPDPAGGQEAVKEEKAAETEEKEEEATMEGEPAGSESSKSDPPVRSTPPKKRRNSAGPAPWVRRTLRLVDTAPDMAAAAWTKWRALRKSEFQGAWGFPEPGAWARTWSPSDWRESARGLLGRWAKEARSLAVDPRAGLWLGACSAAVCGVLAWRQNALLSELKAQHIELIHLTRQVEKLRQQ